MYILGTNLVLVLNGYIILILNVHMLTDLVCLKARNRFNVGSQTMVNNTFSSPMFLILLIAN